MDKIDKIEDFIQHHGVKGMRWGVRRYQPYQKGAGKPKGKFLNKKKQAKQDYKDSVKNIRSQNKSGKLSKTDAGKAKLEAYHKSQPKKSMYSTIYENNRKSGMDKDIAIADARKSTRDIKTTLSLGAAQMAVGAIIVNGEKIGKTYRSVAPKVTRTGKNFVQAMKNSPIRYVDGATMKNIVRDASALAGR